MNPQRLDTLVGKILRIVPDLREHTATSTVSENGRYRIPNDNPFSTLEGARKEIWAYGLRNPHRLIWDVDPARPHAPRLLAFNIGLAAWETVVIIRKGANYGYSLREGTQMMSSDGMGAIPAGRHDSDPDLGHGRRAARSSRPTRSSSTRTWRRTAATPSPAGSSTAAAGSPRSEDKLVFGDITTGRIWYAELADVLAADDGNPATVAQIHEMDAGLRRLVEDDLPRARRQGRGAARRGRRLRPWPRGLAVRGRQRGRALHPHEERRDDQEGRGRQGDVTRRDATRGPRRRAPARTSRIRTPANAHESRARPRRSRSPPGRRRTTPTAPPVTATWRRVR